MPAAWDAGGCKQGFNMDRVSTLNTLSRATAREAQMTKGDWGAESPEEAARQKREAWAIGGLMVLGLILSAISCIG